MEQNIWNHGDKTSTAVSNLDKVLQLKVINRYTAHCSKKIQHYRLNITIITTTGFIVFTI